MGNALQFRPKTSKFQSYKCCACHYAFARGVHAPCDGLLILRQNNSYYRLFPHSSFTQLESLMTAASTYPTETLFNILQTPSYAKLFKFFKSAKSTLLKPPLWKRQVWCDCPAFYFGSFYLDHLGSSPHGCITEGGALLAIFGKLCYQLPPTPPSAPSLPSLWLNRLSTLHLQLECWIAGGSSSRDPASIRRFRQIVGRPSIQSGHQGQKEIYY